MKKQIPVYFGVLIFFLIWSPEVTYAQQKAFKTISGKVADGMNEPLAGVTVMIKGKQTVAQTNNDGFYSIPVADSVNVILRFSYLGFTTREVWVAAKNTILNVVLQSDVKALDDVVIIGYGSVRRRDLTGSVGQADVEDMKKAPVPSFAEALAGRVAGVQVNSSDGQPGNEMNIVVRGNNSVTQDNSPLYVIDGFPVEAASNNIINPEEIESIEVLKDASATAIYGARGANGVIMITTKKGKKGEPVVSYDGWAGSHQVIKRQEVLSPYEFVKYQLEQNPTVYTPIYLNNGKTIEDYRDVKGINWQDQVLRTALVQNHNLAIRGGNDKTRYSLSGSYLDQQGVVLNSGFRRYQGRFGLEQDVSTKFRASVNINYSATKRYGTIATETQTSPTASLMYSMWGFRPVTGDSIKDANLLEELFDPDIDPGANTDLRINPLLATINEYNPLFNNVLIVNTLGEYKITKDLSFRVTGGLTSTNQRRELFNNSNSRLGHNYTNNKVNGSINNREITNLLNENTIRYNKRFNKDHNLKVLAGITMQDIRDFSNGFTSTLVPNESLGIKGLDEGQITVAPTTDLSSGLLSYLSRVDYSYKSRYLFTASIRADGSSKFPKDHRWAYFPSAAFAWRVKDESFMQKLEFLSEGKVRIGYGATGNNRVGEYAALTALQINASSGYATGNSAGQGIVPTNLGNAALKWETTVQTNAGMDLGFFKNRVSLTADYYYKETKDLLLRATLAPSMGFLYAFKNIGKVSNRGLELTLNTVNIERKNFSWSSGFNIAFNRNKVLSLNEDEPSLATRVTWGNFNNAFPYIAIPGKPIALFYGMLFDGVYQYSDFDETGSGSYVLKRGIPNNGVARENIKPGDIRFKDINGDGQIDNNDLTIIGDPNPLHTGGFNNNLSYKKFDLNIFLQWSYGGDLLNANRIEFEGGDPVTRNFLNMFKSFENRWTPENQTNDLYRVGGQGPAVYSSRTIEDGSFLRLKTVALGYTLPATVLKKIKVKTLRMYAAAQNLVTWTNYSGLDPEVSTVNSALTPGFDWSPYPRPRTITLGLNATF